MVLDSILEYSVSKLEKEIGKDNNKIGIIGPAVSELILRGEGSDNPDCFLIT